MSDHGESIIFNHPEPTEPTEVPDTAPAETAAPEPTKLSARKSKAKADPYQPFTW